MPTLTNAVVVLIASPGDTGEERAAVRDALNDWNVTSGRRQQVVAMPWLYERHAVPEQGDRAQSVINEQAVDRADIVIAIFDSRLGTHTGVDISGTAEEINRADDLGKPVHVYFSGEPLSRDTDPKQLAALQAFRDELRTRGLQGTYMDPQDLAGQTRSALEHDIEKHGWSEPAPQVTKTQGARLTWRHEPSDNQLIARNEGDVAANEFEFEVTEIGETMVTGDEPGPPVTFHPESELSWLCIPIQPGTISILARWSENGRPQEITRTVTVRG